MSEPATLKLISRFLFFYQRSMGDLLHNIKPMITIKQTKVIVYSMFAIIIIIVITCVGSSSDEPRTGTKTNEEAENQKPKVDHQSMFLAYSYASDHVKKNLKSPSTAKFPRTFEKAGHIIDNGNNLYIINSWVDSQNSYGATIRTKFLCKVFMNDSIYVIEEFYFY